MSSSNNTLVAGSFDVTISVIKTSAESRSVNAITVTQDTSDPGVYSCTLPESGVYTVIFKLTDESTVKGHCIVKVGSDSEKHTEAIIGEQTENLQDRALSDPFTFTIEVFAPTAVTFEPRWGEVVTPDITNEQVYSYTN